MPKILVVGATGNVGRELVTQLKDHDVHVRAMVRSPESACLLGREVVQGDLTVPDSLDRCLDGIDSMFLVWQAPPDTVEAALERITRRVRHVVFLSNLTVRDDSEDQGYIATALHAKIERLIAKSGARFTFLRPGAFSANALIWWAPQIRRGDVVRWPYGDAALSPIHEADIAAVAVRALTEDKHDGAKYIITGPEVLTMRQQVETIGDAIGRSLRYEEIAPDVARQEMSSIMPVPIADMLLKAFAVATGQPAPVTSTVEQVTGRPARALRQWTLDHVGKFDRMAGQA